MSAKQRSERTLKLRAIADEMRETEPRRELPTLPEMEPQARSIPQQAADKWSGTPGWARGIVLVLVTIAGSSAVWIQLIEAFKQ